MKDHARGADLYGFWLSELTQDTSLQEKYKTYYDAVRKCQEICEHSGAVDSYCFLCNKFFEEE